MICAPGADLPGAHLRSAASRAGAMKMFPTRQQVIEAEMGQRGEFGAAVAIRGDLAAVAAPRAMVDREAVGTVSIFSLDSPLLRSPLHGHGRSVPPGWDRPRAQRLGSIVPRDLNAGARFGAALTFGSDSNGRPILAIGSPGATGSGGDRAGMVRIFRLQEADAVSVDAPLTSALVAELHPPEGSAGAAFGESLAFDASGQRLAVGAPLSRSPSGVPFAGEVCVYRRIGDRWQRESILRAMGAGVAATFGMSLQWVQDTRGEAPTLVIGAPGDGRIAPGAGRVFGFRAVGSAQRQDSGPWGLAWELSSRGPAQGTAGSRFGESLGSPALGMLAVGVSGRGAVELFDLAGSMPPVHGGTLLDPTQPGATGFGGCLAGVASGSQSGWLMVGAPRAVGPAGRPGAGAAYLYRLAASGQWDDPIVRHGQPAFDAEFGVSLDVSSLVGGGVAWIAGEPGSSLPCSSAQPTCAAGAAHADAIAR